MRTPLLTAAATLLATAAAVPAAQAKKPERYVAELTTKAEVKPPKDADEAHGEATYTISSTGKSIRFRVEFDDLSSDTIYIHLHVGKPKQSGPPVHFLAHEDADSPLTGRISARTFKPGKEAKAKGIRTFADLVKAFRAKRTYTNVHTETNKDGEIRGQNLPAAKR